MENKDDDASSALDDTDDVESLKVHIRELKKEKELREAEFGQKRAKLKELFLHKEEELRREKEALESTKKDRETLEADVRRLQAELDETRSMVTIAECQKENEIEAERRKCHEEIASLQHIMKEAVSDAMRSTSTRYEKEIGRFKKSNEKLESELSDIKNQQYREREGVLAAVTKTLKQRVGGLSSPIPFAPASGDSVENLEESMRKAQEDAEMLRSLVLPLEEEIKALKKKLRSTDEQLRMYETAFSGLVKGLGSDSLAEMVKGKTPAEVVEHLDEKLTSLSQGLQAEKASRSDLEMYVAVLNTQKAVMQEDMDRIKQELQEVCQLLETEKREHASLKRTWQMANDQFLETQRLQIMDMRRMQSVLTAEQQRQIGELQRKDAEKLEQERRLNWVKKEPEKEADKTEEVIESGQMSPFLHPSPSKIIPGSLHHVVHHRLGSEDSKTEDEVDATVPSSGQRTRSIPANLDQAGLGSIRDRRRSLSSSAINGMMTHNLSLDEKILEATETASEMRSLLPFEDMTFRPVSPKKLPSLTQDQLKALSDTTLEQEVRKTLIDNARAETESFSLVGKRLVSESEWQLLEEELRRAREKLGQPCEMCSNYELQLQQVQQAEQEQRRQVTGLEQVLECYKEDLKREQAYRQEMEQKFTGMAKDSEEEITNLFKKLEETEKAFADWKSKFDACYKEVHSQLKQVTKDRETMKIELTRLETENNFILGKHIAQAQQLQNEVINLPDNPEEMQFHCLKLQEDLITAIVAKERIEGSLKSEILFLKNQLTSEQTARDRLVETLMQDIDSLREQVGIMESLKTELESIRASKTKIEDDLLSAQNQLSGSQKEHEQTFTTFKQQCEELQTTKLSLENEAHELRAKVQSLQTDLDNSEAVQRDFVKLSQSLQMELEKIRQSDTEVRWQHEDDAADCNACKKVFHSRKEKHHCSHCGKIFCSECCSKTVFSGPKQRPFKVCSVCHTLLDHDTAPYFSSEPPQTPS